MAKLRTCDVCRKPKEITHKLLLGPAKASAHSAYTDHADVCDECAPKLKQLINFSPRKPHVNKRKPKEKK